MLRRAGSTTILIALAVLLTLQAIPYTGVFLMLFGAPLIAGLLVHAALLAFAAEALTGRASRELILIPIVAYGGYYAVYAYQGFEIAQKVAELRRANPGQIFAFDPAQHSLITSEAETFVKTHEVPVAYVANGNFRPERYLAFRLLPRDRCGRGVDSQGRVLWSGVHFNGKFQNHLCELRMPEAPQNKAVHAIRKGDDEVWKRKRGIMEQTTEIVVDGAVVGSYRSASVWRLPKVPLMYIGCGLISSGPKWDCGFDFMREFVTVDTAPDSVDHTKYDTPVSVMLGLRKYTATDITNFKGYAQNASAPVRAVQEPARVDNEVFEVLRLIVAGKNPEPPHNMAYSISTSPLRLVPFAQAMAKRLTELVAEAHTYPHREAQVDALARGIVSLPRSAYAPIADEIFELVQQRPYAAQRNPALYIRAADAGAKTFAFYKSAIFAGGQRRFDPALALAVCRIGSADTETMAEFRRRFLEDVQDHGGAKSSLLLVLVKLGETTFVRENLQMVPARRRDWADLVLSGQGMTDAGPNNCMTEDWGYSSYLGPAMLPSLEKDSRSGWKRRAGT